MLRYTRFSKKNSENLIGNDWMHVNDNASVKATITGKHLRSMITVNKQRSNEEQEEDNQKVNLSYYVVLHEMQYLDYFLINYI